MKALIPAAGLGTRWYPWSRVVPKELLPLGNYPAIHYVLEEVVAAGITEIGIIISPTKELIRRYVEEIWISNHPEVRVTWFYQCLPRGVADALLCASDWVQDNPTAVLYPDEIHPKEGGLIQLRRAYENSSGCWIGLTKNKQNRRQAILQIEKVGGNVFRVCGFCSEKGVQMTGYGTGRYIIDSGLSYMGNYSSLLVSEDFKELDDDKIFELIWENGVFGIILSDPIFDIGTPTTWLDTITNYPNMRLLP